MNQQPLTGVFSQTFIVEGKYLGTAMRNLALHSGVYERPRSFAFFCPKCADLWARCPVDGSEDWMVWTKLCRRHPSSSFTVAGSLFLSWEQDFAAAFPEGVLRWELDRHLDYAETLLL